MPSIETMSANLPDMRKMQDIRRHWRSTANSPENVDFEPKAELHTYFSGTMFDMLLQLNELEKVAKREKTASGDAVLSAFPKFFKQLMLLSEIESALMSISENHGENHLRIESSNS